METLSALQRRCLRAVCLLKPWKEWCFCTHGTLMARAASKEAGCLTTTSWWFCLSLHWGSPVGTTSSLYSCRHYKAAGSRSATRLACSTARCTLLSSAACCHQPSLCPSVIARLWWEESPSNLCLSSERKSSPTCKPEPLWWDLYLCRCSSSWLLVSAEFSTNPAPAAKIEPSCFHPMASTLLNRRKYWYLTEGKTNKQTNNCKKKMK